MQRLIIVVSLSGLGVLSLHGSFFIIVAAIYTFLFTLTGSILTIIFSSLWIRRFKEFK